MAWVIEAGAQMLDGGLMVAPRVGLDAFEEMLAGDDRVAVAVWAIDAIADGTWKDFALDLVDEATRNCFVENWDNPTMLAGFENVLRKVIALDLPIKVTGLVGDGYAVASNVKDDHIAVRVWAPLTGRP